MKSLGATYTHAEQASFMAIWRYSGLLIGVPETVLCRNQQETMRALRIGYRGEPDPDEDPIAMAYSFFGAAPLVVGITEPDTRWNLSDDTYGVSHALSGDELAGALNYPSQSTFGVLRWFRLQSHLSRLSPSSVPGLGRHSNHTNFTSLIDVSKFDEQGISYLLSDHVLSEQSSVW